MYATTTVSLKSEINNHISPELGRIGESATYSTRNISIYQREGVVAGFHSVGVDCWFPGVGLVVE